MENFDRCPACNSELDESTHCPGCGSAVPGCESAASTPDAPAVLDLGFEVVQGAAMAEDDFMSAPPPTAPAVPNTPSAIEPPKDESASPPAPTQEPPLAEESSGLELESLVDPAELEAAQQAAQAVGGLELESMISVPEPAAAPTRPDEEPVDLELEMVEPEAAETPPPVVREKKTVRDSKRATGASSRPSSAADGRKTGARESSAMASSGETEAQTKTKEQKKGIGLLGFLARAALLIGVVLGSLAVAYPPGITMLRDLINEIPLIGGAKGIRYVNNLLVDPVEVLVDDSVFGQIAPGERMEIPVKVGEELVARIVRPVQSSGVRAGDDLSIPLADPLVAGHDEHYRLKYQAGLIWVFAPLITNPTDRDMMALINAGTGRARPCNCVIPAGARDHHIGYYAFEAGLRIRFVDASAEYNSRRYREVSDVTDNVDPNSGAVTVTIPRR